VARNLGHAFKVGAVSAANFAVAGGWVCTFNENDMPSDQEFECWHGAIRGPGGYFLVYVDDKLFGVGENGTINEYAPPGGAMLIRKGETVTLNWTISTGAAPRAWLYFRQPEVGRI